MLSVSRLQKNLLPDAELEDDDDEEEDEEDDDEDMIQRFWILI